jgi:cytochrome c553
VIFTTRAAIVASITLTIAVGVALATPPPFDDLRNQTPIHGDAAAGAAKAAACAACHGPTGISPSP